MNIVDFLSIALTILIIALSVVRMRARMSTSLNPVKLYRDRRDVVESARKNHPSIFGNSE